VRVRRRSRRAGALLLADGRPGPRPHERPEPRQHPPRAGIDRVLHLRPVEEPLLGGPEGHGDHGSPPHAVGQREDAGELAELLQVLSRVDRFVGHLGAAGLRESGQRVRVEVVDDLLHQFHERIEVLHARLDLALHRHVDPVVEAVPVAVETLADDGPRHTILEFFLVLFDLALPRELTMSSTVNTVFYCCTIGAIVCRIGNAYSKGGVDRRPQVRSKLNLEMLDGRDLPSATIVEPPEPPEPPGTVAPPTMDPAYEAYLAQVDTAGFIFEASFTAAYEQFANTVDAAIDQAASLIHPIMASCQATLEQQESALSAANDAAYAIYAAAWEAAAGDPAAQQAAYDSYIATVESATIQANAAIEAAHVTLVSSIETVLNQLNASVEIANATLQVAIENAIQVFYTTEEVAWNAMMLADGNAPIPDPQVVNFGDPLQNRPRIGEGRIIQGIQRIGESLRPVRTLPPKSGDGIQLWPPGMKVIGNKPLERTIITGPRGGQIIIIGPG